MPPFYFTLDPDTFTSIESNMTEWLQWRASNPPRCFGRTTLPHAVVMTEFEGLAYWDGQAMFVTTVYRVDGPAMRIASLTVEEARAAHSDAVLIAKKTEPSSPEGGDVHNGAITV